MSETVTQIIYWTPRVIGILITALFAAVSFDVFAEGQPLWTSMGALLIHLIPAALLGAVLAVSWRREWVGGVVFMLLSGVYIVAFRGDPIAAYLWVSLSLFIAGGLFLAGWWLRSRPAQDDR